MARVDSARREDKGIYYKVRGRILREAASCFSGISGSSVQPSVQKMGLDDLLHGESPYPEGVADHLPKSLQGNGAH